MANPDTQIGDTRVYTNVDEANSSKKQQCPKCKVFVVPRGISSTRPTAAGEKHCPNCGHIFGRDAQAE
jgi:ribosomal protein S27AE